jgi:general stress protein 26
MEKTMLSLVYQCKREDIQHLGRWAYIGQIMTKSELQRFISKHSLAVVGSISPEGVPQSALVGIAVTEDLEIVFDTLNTTRKYRNLVSNANACVVVGWEDEKTVQFEGEAFLPEGEAQTRYKNAYFERWPDGPSRQNWPGLVYFVIRPRWIRYSDFNQQPAVIEETIFGS